MVVALGKGASHVRFRDGLAGLIFAFFVSPGASFGGENASAPWRKPVEREPACHFSMPTDGEATSEYEPVGNLESLLDHAAARASADPPIAPVRIQCGDAITDAIVAENDHRTEGQSFEKYLQENEEFHAIDTRGARVFYVSRFDDEIAQVRICAHDANHSAEWHDHELMLFAASHVIRADCGLKGDERVELEVRLVRGTICLIELQRDRRTLVLRVSGENPFCQAGDPVATAKRLKSIAASLGFLQ